MWAATAWDDDDWDGARARGWTVMGRLYERQKFTHAAAIAVRKKQRDAQRADAERRRRGELPPRPHGHGGFG